MSLQNFALTSTASCLTEAFEPSYVLRAIGLTNQDAYSSLRIGIGRYTT